VLCLWFPAVLTTPALRDVYPMDLVRATIKWTLGVAFALGVLSVLLKRRKALGLTGAGLATLGTVMGGSRVAVTGPVARSHHVGLDWFLLDLFLLWAIFVPLELLFDRLREQPFFHPGWRTDLWHFGVSHLLGLAHYGPGRPVLPLGDGARAPGLRGAPRRGIRHVRSARRAVANGLRDPRQPGARGPLGPARLAVPTLVGASDRTVAASVPAFASP
jgi:hypothetical protein